MGFGTSDLAQFYIRLWLDTDGEVTLSRLGEWEEENLFEYEAYMAGYVRRLEAEAEAVKKSRQQSRQTGLKRR